MKSKKILCCLLAAAFTVGSTGVGAFAVETDDQQNSSVRSSIGYTYTFDWDKSSSDGITAPIYTASREVSLLKDGQVIASDKIRGSISVQDGSITISSSVLSKLGVGEFSLELHTMEGVIQIKVRITDNREKEPEEVPVVAPDSTSFTWERGSEEGIVINTNSTAESFVVRSGLVVSSSLTSKSVSIADGQISLGSSFLERLKNGDNTLSFVLKDGKFDVSVNVVDNSAEPEPEPTVPTDPTDPVIIKDIVAEQTEFEWDRSQHIGIAVKTNSDSGSVRITKDGELVADNSELGLYVVGGRVGIAANILKRLDDGENNVELEFSDGIIPVSILVTDEKTDPSEDEFVLSADETEFDWDRTNADGILIHTNSSAKNYSLLKNGKPFASSLLNKEMWVSDGFVYIDAATLNRLGDGENYLTLVLKEGKIDISVNVTAGDPDVPEDIVVHETDFTWDRKMPVGIAIGTTSRSKNVAIEKDGEVVADSSEFGLYIFGGRVGIMPNVLKRLDDGLNNVVLVFDDGSAAVNITVTDNGADPGNKNTIEADSTSFDWDRSSDTGIFIQTSSGSKNYSVLKDGKPFASSLVNRDMSVSEGLVYIDNKTLGRLDDGENKLSLVMKEGVLEITVNVTDKSAIEPSGEGISAEQDHFTWDRRKLVGIAVKTNSKSKTVSIKKDGEVLFKNKDKGVYLTFGRVGIMANILRKLPDGDNELEFEFEDGTVPVTVTITDSKGSSEEPFEIVADRTVFTWFRGSEKSIEINTNSDSENVSLQIGGRLSKTSDKKSVSIDNGTITISPYYLETLSDGANDITVYLDDGSFEILVNVAGEEYDSGKSGGANSGSSYGGDDGDGTDWFTSWRNSSSGGYSGDVPETGSDSFAVGALASAAVTSLAGIAVFSRKKKHGRIE